MITLKNLTYEKAGKKILNNINLTINKGEFISIIGKNGSGKSTLAKHFSGILTPNFGNVFIDKKNTKDENNIYEIRKKVGMIFQNPENQIIQSTVEEEIAFGMENLCFPKNKMISIIKQVLEIVGLSGFEKKDISTLSGGQKQRLNIASVVAMNPEIIVLDEPTSMLDPISKKEIFKILKNLNLKFKTTIILITHFMQEVLSSDKIILLENGKIKHFGTPTEFFLNYDLIKTTEPTQAAEILYFLKNLGYEVLPKSFSDEDCSNEIARILKRSTQK